MAPLLSHVYHQSSLLSLLGPPLSIVGPLLDPFVPSSLTVVALRVVNTSPLFHLLSTLSLNAQSQRHLPPNNIRPPPSQPCVCLTVGFTDAGDRTTRLRPILLPMSVIQNQSS